MRILFGIQGTGNGHLSRGLELVLALRARGHDVEVLVSGRPPAKFWLERGLGAVEARKGLTFLSRGGRIRYLTSARQMDFATLLDDVRALDASRFDLVVSDFEPITAWTARRADLPCIGVANQYALRLGAPIASGDPLGRLILAGLAPVACPLGLHWHHYGARIFPPIVARDVVRPALFSETRVLVYLPYEDRDRAVNELRRLRRFDFEFYTNVPAPIDFGNVRLRPLDREEMLWVLNGCVGVLCNAGFALSSEALHLGKRLMVIPARRQIEQASNALALKALGLATISRRLDETMLGKWLAQPATPPRSRPLYPDVAGIIADLVTEGRWEAPRPRCDAPGMRWTSSRSRARHRRVLCGGSLRRRLSQTIEDAASPPARDHGAQHGGDGKRHVDTPGSPPSVEDQRERNKHNHQVRQSER